MYLTAEQIELGKTNFLTALGKVRGKFLRESLNGQAVGPYYFGYGAPPEKPVRAGIIGTGNEGSDAMIRQSSPDYLEFIAYHDIRPTQIERARRRFKQIYGPQQGEKVTFHEKWEEMLANDDIEAIVIATPLWTHARFAIEALEAGKHVLCEKLMAHNITDAKAMVRAADKAKRVLSVGHQRHYSTLYDNALAVIRSGVLGEIRHINALWHRNNTWPREEYKASADKPKTGEFLNDSWYPEIPEGDRSVDFAKYGYKSIEELIRWRLFQRTGGGLMAELGSHQLDACSLFLEKVHPLRVAATGGKYFFEDDRECEDHVYCTYEMPGNVVVTYSSINTNMHEGYGEVIMGTKGTLMIMRERDVILFKENEPGEKTPPTEMLVNVEHGQRSKLNDLTRQRAADDKKAADERMPAEDRQKLDAEIKSIAAEVANDNKSGVDQAIRTRDDLGLPMEAALAKVALEEASIFQPQGAAKAMPNRGYYNEIEAFAHAVRNPGAKIRCDGRVALADAVMALTTNVAIKNHQRIEFKDSWYDPASDEVPDSRPDHTLAGQP